MKYVGWKKLLKPQFQYYPYPITLTFFIYTLYYMYTHITNQTILNIIQQKITNHDHACRVHTVPD